MFIHNKSVFEFAIHTMMLFLFLGFVDLSFPIIHDTKLPIKAVSFSSLQDFSPQIIVI